MTRDAVPIKRALNETEPGDQSDVYTLLGTWNAALDEALAESGDRYRTQFHKHREAAVELVDAAAVDDGPDWTFLHRCAEAYPSGTGDHNCTAIIANVIGRSVVRTRVRHGVHAIPAWALEYLGGVTVEDDGDFASSESSVFGWGIGHDDVAVADRTVDRAETENEYWAASVLEQAMYADAHAAIDCYERLLQSPETTEDLHHVEAMGRIVTDPAPRVPRFWDPTTELDYEGALTDEENEHLLRVLGEHVHSNRLEQFDDLMEFDLQRAASEYGSTEST